MDDEESIRKLLKAMLSALGHEVTCAREGAEAIALYKAVRVSGRSFDGVLLDLTVKGGMGVSMLLPGFERRIHPRSSLFPAGTQIHRCCPIFASTASTP